MNTAHRGFETFGAADHGNFTPRGSMVERVLDEVPEDLLHAKRVERQDEVVVLELDSSRSRARAPATSQERAASSTRARTRHGSARSVRGSP